MTKICLLIQYSDHIEDGNYLRIGQALVRSGHEVNCCFIDSLALSASQVTAKGFSLDESLRASDPFPETTPTTLAEHQLIWILSVGNRSGFLDKVQLLYSLPDNVQVANSLDAIMHLKSKYYLTSREIFHCPETHASNVAADLIAIIRSSGGRWIVKPPAGSLGRDVFLTDSNDKNLAAIIEHMCGKDDDNYALIQRYVPEIEQGEKRVLMAGGNIVGQYKRLAEKDHRTNVSQGASIHQTDLNDDETNYCLELGKFLSAMGAHFVGLDLVYPWLIEVNVVNPGGLATIDELYGTDLTDIVAISVLKASLPEAESS